MYSNASSCRGTHSSACCTHCLFYWTHWQMCWTWQLCWTHLSACWTHCLLYWTRIAAESVLERFVLPSSQFQINLGGAFSYEWGTPVYQSTQSFPWSGDWLSDWLEPLAVSQQLLRRNVKRFRRGLVFKARRLVYHSTLGSRVINRKREAEGCYITLLSPFTYISRFSASCW